MGRLSGKTALISGTGAGMGRSAALKFAAEGARVVGCDVHAENAEETVRLVREAGGEMVSLAPVDLSSREGAQRWVDFAVEQYGPFDILYNNASAMRNVPFAEMTDEDWYFTIQNELHIVYHCCKAAWAELSKRGGTIINVGSISGLRGATFVEQSAHGAAKGGVIALTRHLAVAGADVGIRVNTISPGLIRTPATAPFIDDPDGPAQAVLHRLPVRRFGQPEDVANVAAFLASDESNYISAANIVVDGGDSALAG